MVALILRSKGEVCLCELADSLDEPEYKLSRHLKILKNSGFLDSVRDGKWIYHSLVADKGYLTAIHQAIRTFPDTEKQFQKDFARFEKRIALRERGRCKTPAATVTRPTQVKARNA